MSNHIVSIFNHLHVFGFHYKPMRTTALVVTMQQWCPLRLFRSINSSVLFLKQYTIVRFFAKTPHITVVRIHTKKPNVTIYTITIPSVVHPVHLPPLVIAVVLTTAILVDENWWIITMLKLVHFLWTMISIHITVNNLFTITISIKLVT